MVSNTVSIDQINKSKCNTNYVHFIIDNLEKCQTIAKTMFSNEALANSWSFVFNSKHTHNHKTNNIFPHTVAICRQKKVPMPAHFTMDFCRHCCTFRIPVHQPHHNAFNNDHNSNISNQRIHHRDALVHYIGF